MRLVKAVTGEFLDKIEDLDGQHGIDALRRGAVFEDATLLGHLLGFFLAHRPAQQIRPPKRIARQHLCNLHHLLLIQNDAVGGLQNGFQPFMLVLRVGIGQRLAPVLTIDEVLDHAGLQRPGSEQGHQRDDVLETVGTQIFDQFLHAATFKLEHCGGVTTLQHAEDLGVIQRQAVNVERLLCPGIDHLDRPLNDRQRTQAEKIELHQARFFNIVLVVLGDDTATVLVAVNG